MIFAAANNSSLIVAAADDVAELETFYSKAILSKDKIFDNEYQPSVIDMMMDQRFLNFKKPPYVFEFDDEITRENFAKIYHIEIVPDFILVDKHKAMLASLENDPYAPNADARLIGEILGLEDNDPWDQRTEEQRAQDEENRKEAEIAKKAGKLSGDSFGPSKRTKKKNSEIGVKEITTHEDNDGNLVIDNVLAVKGLYDDNGKGVWLPRDSEVQEIKVADAEPDERFYRFQTTEIGHAQAIDTWLELLGVLPEPKKVDPEIRSKIIVGEGENETSAWFAIRNELIANKLFYLLKNIQIQFTVDVVDANFVTIDVFVQNEALAQYINPQGHIAIYHRIDVINGELAEVLWVLDKESAVQQKDLISSIVAARGQMQDYCWLACATKYGAEEIEQVLKKNSEFANSEIEIYGVNDLGERLVPKGIEILEEDHTPEPPRPWNDKAFEWHAMTDEQRKADEVAVMSDEFIYSGSYKGAAGCIVYVTPRSYFKRTGEMWNQPLDSHWFPQDMKQISPGVFQTKSRNWIDLNNELAKRGLVESLALQLYINLMD